MANPGSELLIPQPRALPHPQAPAFLLQLLMEDAGSFVFLICLPVVGVCGVKSLGEAHLPLSHLPQPLETRLCAPSPSQRCVLLLPPSPRISAAFHTLLRFLWASLLVSPPSAPRKGPDLSPGPQIPPGAFPLSPSGSVSHLDTPSFCHLQLPDAGGPSSGPSG